MGNAFDICKSDRELGYFDTREEAKRAAWYVKVPYVYKFEGREEYVIIEHVMSKDAFIKMMRNKVSAKDQKK